MCIILEYMTSGDLYFGSKCYSSVQAMTPLYGGATSGLKRMTPLHRVHLLS